MGDGVECIEQIEELKMSNVQENKLEQSNVEENKKNELESVTEIKYQSEIFARNSSIFPFKIVVEETIQGNYHNVTIKKISRDMRFEKQYEKEEIIRMECWRESDR